MKDMNGNYDLKVGDLFYCDKRPDPVTVVEILEDQGAVMFIDREGIEGEGKPGLWMPKYKVSPRIDIYLYTYLEINKNEFIGGSMHFYEIETTTPKDSYFDSSNYVPHPNPIIADSEGRFPKIFIEKPYRVSISNRDGQVVFHDDYE